MSVSGCFWIFLLIQLDKVTTFQVKSGLCCRTTITAFSIAVKQKIFSKHAREFCGIRRWEEIHSWQKLVQRHDV